LENALAYASRILPIVTTAHMPSAACDAYWPEIYWNQPMVTVARANPYTDSPTPRTFCNVSPLDPQLFSRIADFAEEMLKGKRSGKYSPIEVAQWLEDLAAAAEKELDKAGERESAEFRRLAIDVNLQIGLGRFFAAKFRSGVLYTIHAKTGDHAALEEALAAYRKARAAWAGMKESASAYAADLSVSDRFDERGQWNDRLALIDEDIAEMEQGLGSTITMDDERVGLGGGGSHRAAKAGERELPASGAGAIPAEGSDGDSDRGVREGAVGADVLSARESGGALRECRDGGAGGHLSGDNSGELHRFALPAAILLRDSRVGGESVALSRLRAGLGESALFCGAERVG
jgi:hypothetical protein